MLANMNLTSIKTYLTFPMRDREASNRFAIGAALSAANFIIPIVPAIFVAGYLIRVMRRTLEEHEPGMPAWEDWGKLFWDGFRIMIVSWIYFLPAMLVSIFGFACYMVTMMAMSFNAGEGDSAFFLVFPLAFMIMFLSMFLGMFLNILAAVPFPAATANFAAKDRFSAAFQFQELLKPVRRNGMGYFVAWVILMGLFGLAYLAYMLLYMSVFLCFLSTFAMAILAYYAMLVGASLFAEAYMQGSEPDSAEVTLSEAPARPESPEPSAKLNKQEKPPESELPIEGK